VLGPEVVEQPALGDAGALGDRLERGGALALLDEEGCERTQDLGAGGGGRRHGSEGSGSTCASAAGPRRTRRRSAEERRRCAASHRPRYDDRARDRYCTVWTVGSSAPPRRPDRPEDMEGPLA